MEELVSVFEERIAEVEVYVSFLRLIERSAQNGPPRFEHTDVPISAQQQKILYSSVYLQLYNLVESTMTLCIDTVSHAAADSGQWKVSDLCEDMRKEWVKATARTHVEMTAENRLSSALQMTHQLISSGILSSFPIEKGGGGNWDDSAIESFSKRLGFQLEIERQIYRGVKQKIREDLGALALVKYLRNQLAHGAVSFAECAEGVTVSELIELKDRTINYLREVVRCFLKFIENYEFILLERRPGHA